MRRQAAIAVTAGVVLGALVISGHAAGADIAAGKEFAELACSACHQVRAGQPEPAPIYDPDRRMMVQAPSFMTIARERGDDAAWLRSVIMLPHYPMREQAISETDLDALIAYMRSLRESGPRRP
jgi:mono/diheme cytochrome c family protein